jgi:pimeloyl-ACP methyl ester carboxylesterase
VASFSRVEQVITRRGSGGKEYSMSAEENKAILRQVYEAAFNQENLDALEEVIASDLHQLLETAEVPGPYVLAGSSIGGFFVQLYGRRYSEEVVGVVAMNPEPPADQIVERIHPLAGFTKEVREEDRAYLRGENPEGIDWFASSEELNKAPGPPPIPFEMLLSKKVPGCEGDPLCLKSDDT